jgi:hypothetical protein
MKLLLPTETQLDGKWIESGKSVVADETCKRIDYLTSTVLKKIAVSKEHGAWETLYQDATDERFWEKTFPHGEMHGGGPPSLRMIPVDEASKKYAIK